MMGILQRIDTILSGIDIANWLLEITVEISILLMLLYPFRKWLMRRISPRHIVWVLLVYFVRTVFMLGRGANLLQSMLGTVIDPWVRVYFPIRIHSHIAGVKSICDVDWLWAANIVWLVGFMAYGYFYPNKEWAIDPKAVQYDGLERIQEQFDKHHQMDYWIGYWHDCEVRVGYLPGLKSPCTASIPNPTILLDRLDYTDEELDMIFRHELSHVGGEHQLLLWHVKVMRRVFWFNPLIRYFRNWCEDMTEFASDESAMLHAKATPQHRKKYALLLAEIAEKQGLQGTALYLSAGARMIRERTKAVLAPNSRALSVPLLTIIVLVWIGIGSVITSAQSEFAEPSQLLSMLGNDFDSIVRIDTAAADRTITVEAGGIRLYMDKEYNTDAIRILTNFDACESDAELQALYSDCERMVTSFSACIGTPVSTGGLTMKWSELMEYPHKEQEARWIWPVELSAEVQKKLGYDPNASTYVFLSVVQNAYVAEQYVTYRIDLGLKQK